MKSIFAAENKMMLTVIGCITVVFMVAFYFVNQHYHHTLEDQYHQYGTAMARNVGIGIEQHLTEELSAELRIREYIDAMVKANPDVAGISWSDAEGKPQNASGITQPQQAYETAGLVLKSKTGAVLGDTKVFLNGKTLKTTLDLTRPIVIGVFFTIFLVSILAILFNAYTLSKHLKTLVSGVKRLSSGDFGHRIPEEPLWGELKTLAAAFNDMSYRLRAYEEQNVDTIAFERNKLQAILMSIVDGVVVCDHNGDITILNHSAANTLGAKSPQYLLGSPIQEYVSDDGKKIFAEVYDAFHEQWEEAVASDASLRLSESLDTVKQVTLSEQTLKVILSPIRDAAGVSLGFVMVIHDVTKEAEVDTLKTQFISNVSHELRTPVTTIKSYVDTIYNHGSELDKQTYQEFIETIHLETDRLKKLVNDILDFSRLEQGNIALEVSEQDITPVINLTVQSMKVLAEQKNLTMTTALESNLPQVRINSESIERAIRNLLSNAIKYTPDGGRIRVRAEVSEDGEVLEVSVQDTGEGIPEEHLPFIFDRFYRVENKVHTVKGTGLGLHLVKLAIEKHHHGQVFVKSEMGVGSIFGFRLPLKDLDTLFAVPHAQNYSAAEAAYPAMDMAKAKRSPASVSGPKASRPVRSEMAESVHSDILLDDDEELIG